MSKRTRVGVRTLAPPAEEVIRPDVEPVEIQVVFHPDGYYWIAPDGRQEIGPFTSKEDAIEDAQRDNDTHPEPGESVEEAEDEIGIADWLDPETGEPAEGLCSPRLPPE